MTLNFTLLVQIFHFIIAYCIIDRLFLRKAVATIQKEESDQDNLMRDIQQERDAVAKKQEQKKREWQQFEELFLQKIPAPTEQPAFILYKKKAPSLKELTQDEINQYATVLTSMLVEKVKHDV